MTSMPRRKSTDTPEVKALRRLLLSLGLSTVTAKRIIAQTEGHHADLSAKACDIQLYIAGHPEVRNPSGYAAMTLMNYADELEAKAAMPPAVPAATARTGDSGRHTSARATEQTGCRKDAAREMELWES